MQIGGNFKAFEISSSGMKLQKKKLDLIAENIANTNTTKTSDGTPYKRKTIEVSEKNTFQTKIEDFGTNAIMRNTGGMHFLETPGIKNKKDDEEALNMEVVEDRTPGDKVYMPDHPDANSEGYLEMPNVNIVTEMVDMVAATRSYEANLTAFNASKQMAKDALEI
ncbi:MAG TPA: flagellar basal body rod protein FlgC [Melioribacteraceae bacterium]|nr:flagellar basal body rod protein FlgC [Melioribacteraceae bacterium]